MLLCLGAVLILTSCATVPTQPSGKAGDKKQQQRVEVTLLQAEAALDAGEVLRARRALAALPVDALSDTQRLRRQIGIAKYHLLTNKPEEALAAMRAVEDSFLMTVDRERQVAWFFTYADALAANDAKQVALRLRILLDERLTARESAANHPAMFELMEAISIGDLLSEVKLALDLYMRGWYDFAILRKLHPQYGRLDPSSTWADAYRNHPGTRHLSTLRREQRSIPSAANIERVAFLLPFSGNLAPYSEAIYRGYMDAAASRRARVLGRRYDTAGGESIAALLEQIRADDNQAILGPLRPQAIDELAAANYPREMPLIILNELPADLAGNVYSFELSLEDSVAFAARAAYDDGCRRNILITEATGLGEKMTLALQTLWETQDDVILAKQMQLEDTASAASQISDFLEVSSQEVDATKEIYRRYLRLLNRLEEEEAGAGALLAQQATRRLPKTYPQQNKGLLLTKQEIALLSNANDGLAEQSDARGARLLTENRTDLTSEELLIKFRAEMKAAYTRVDADCIFLAMDRPKALKVRPFLSFYLANDMRVYGTFLLYDSRLDPKLYEDLNQLRYGEMPSVIDAIQAQGGPSPTSDAYGLRFYARGQDLFFLMAFTPDRIAAGPRPLHVAGQSGILVRAAQRITAVPSVATFSAGIPARQSGQSIFQ